MRIAIVAPEQIAVPGSGSVEICVLAIARQLARTQQVTIISRAAAHLPRRTRTGKLNIVRVATGTSAKYARSVVQELRSSHYDWIQVDNRPRFLPVIRQACPGTPVSLFLHSLTFVPATRQIARCMSQATVIIANSHSLRKELVRRFPQLKSKIRTVHLGVDTRRFRPGPTSPASHGTTATGGSAASRKTSARHSFKFTVLFAGRLIKRKGLPVLLRAAQLVRKRGVPLEVKVVGKGKPAYVLQMKRLARKLGVHARFVGKVPHRRIHLHFRQASCFVCPSQQHEAFGLVNVEAMASGLPVVASQIGGITEIIRHGHSGYTVKAYRQPAAFAHYLHKLATEPHTASRIARAGRVAVLRQFSWQQSAQKLQRLYRR